MARIVSDGLPEVALFRIVQVPQRPDLQVERRSFYRFIYINDDVTKTGSGQT
jgi:hypothetical protein